jgi:oligo-1,6-glucosidase
LSKDFKDIKPNTGFRKIIEDYYANGPKIHDYLNEMNEQVMEHYDAFSMGEGVGVNQENAHLYVADERKELDMIYHFDILENNIVNGKYEEISHFDLINVKNIFRNWQYVMDKGGWIANALGNHDFARLVSRFGNDKEYREESAKMLITLMATQNGTLNIYQGDEIGMTNIDLKSINDVNDIQSLNFYKENLERKKFTNDEALLMINKEGRDNARTPMQWTEYENAGFSTHSPWLQINPNYSTINVENQLEDKNSILKYYQRIFALKRENPIFSYGKFIELEKENKNVYAYRKVNNNKEILVFLSFSKSEIVIDYEFDTKKDYDMLINNYSFVTKTMEKLTLMPYQSLIFKINN